MSQLEKKTGTKAPENLRNLSGKPVRFRDVIDREEIFDYVVKYAMEGRK
jgi:hypothetical protein